jgi:exosortase/archaeosortase family protein
MPIRLSPTGIPYFDDGSSAASSTANRRTLGQSLVIFLAVFIAMQALWHWAEGSIVERLLVDHVTVRPAAVLVNLLTPNVRAMAIGTRLSAPGGGINILNGCEGAEIAFLLFAAFAAVRLPWRGRLVGLLTGGLLIYGLNQVRILALFYAYRTDQALFDALHGMVAPVILIAATGLFFHVWVNRASPPMGHAGE